ncbi:MAG: hypothetical protein HOO89_03585 [Ferruginibacter sp.]|nr:hypothetical protein [Ferruginibacter sp.]
MKKKIFYIAVSAVLILFFACNNQNENNNVLNKYVDMSWLDSIVKNSDTSYSKNYKRTDFVSANYYIAYKDSTTC